jgi:hypothetical protein
MKPYLFLIASLFAGAVAGSDYEKQRAALTAKFFQTMKPGMCWAQVYSSESTSSWTRQGLRMERAYLLLARENGLFLIAQPHPDCRETFKYSVRCEYWIREIGAQSVPSFFQEDSQVMPCPKGLSPATIIRRASPAERELFDFSKVKQ